MKIIHIVTQMEAGGAQGAAIRNAAEMRSRGYNATTCFLYVKREIYKNYDGVVVILEEPPQKMADYAKLLFKLALYLKREKPQAIISYTHYANVISAVIGKIVGIKKIIASHRNPVDTYPRLCFIADLIVGSLGFYRKAIAVSETVRDSFSKHPSVYQKKLIVVRNGIGKNNTPSAACKKKYSDLVGSYGDVFKFVITGRLHPQKNHNIIFSALAKVKDAVIFVAGDGELNAYYKNLVVEKNISERVIFLGEIAPSEIYALLMSCDAFLFPSKYEAFGFSVVEAMNAGLPVLCSNIAAMREIVGEAGILISCDSEDEWVSQMEVITKDVKKRNEMSGLSKSRAELFDLDLMVDGYLEAVVK